MALNFLRPYPLSVVEVAPNGEFISVLTNVSVASSMLHTDFEVFLRDEDGASAVRAEMYSLPKNVLSAVTWVGGVSHLGRRLRAGGIRRSSDTSTAPCGCIEGQGCCSSLSQCPNCATPAVLQQYYAIPCVLPPAVEVTNSVFEQWPYSFNPNDVRWRSDACVRHRLSHYVSRFTVTM